MRKDIKELQEIMDELRAIGISGGNRDLVDHAIQIQRTRLFKNALVLSDSDKHPGALEKIAIELESSGKILSRIEDNTDNADRKLGYIETELQGVNEKLEEK